MPHDRRLTTRPWVWVLIFVQVALMLVAVGVLAACGTAAAAPEPTPRPLAPDLVLYDWPDDIPQSILDAFTREYGVTVIYETYESQEAAIENMRAGQVYDVVVMSNDLVPALVDRYGREVPVLMVDGVEVARHRVTAEALKAVLRTRRAGPHPS